MEEVDFFHMNDSCWKLTTEFLSGIGIVNEKPSAGYFVSQILDLEEADCRYNFCTLFVAFFDYFRNNGS